MDNSSKDFKNEETNEVGKKVLLVEDDQDILDSFPQGSRECQSRDNLLRCSQTHQIPVRNFFLS